VSALTLGGWVSTWDDPQCIGGRSRYIVPTAKGLRWALRHIEEAMRGATYARLLATMLRRDGRCPLPLTAGIHPPWLGHLVEVNNTLATLQVTGTVVWSSSWNRPLPFVSHGVTLPQPDGVVVRRVADDHDELTFLEHDRGGESLRHFRARKVDCYRALSQRPALLEELTGYRTFRVLVTVRAGDPDLNERRVEDLQRCASAGLTRGLFTIVPADLAWTAGDLLTNPGGMGHQV